MPLIIPESRSEIAQILQTDFISNIPESDPFIRESWLRALLFSIAGREFDIYTQLQQLSLDLFPTTATGTFARQWGNLKGVDQGAATSASGFISVTGVIGTNIPQGTAWQNTGGSQYNSILQDYSISTRTTQIDSLISSGGIAQASLTSAHNFATGMQVTISGAVETEYNGTFTIVVTSQTGFQYSITGTPTSPATGTILASADFASVNIQASDAGEVTNLDAAAQLTLSSPIAGVDNTALVQFTAIGGGADAETDEEYRARYLERYQNQVAHFNAADITSKAKEIEGTTTVFVFNTTPLIGDVTIYFMRYNDADPIPNAQDVTDMKNNLATITPANTPILDSNDAGLIVKAPIPRTIDFVFSALNPNVETMKEAIEASLTQFFIDDMVVGENISSEDYNNAIKQTVDVATGNFVKSFTLIEPVGDIDIDDGEIGIFGNITFNI